MSKSDLVCLLRAILLLYQGSDLSSLFDQLILEVNGEFGLLLGCRCSKDVFHDCNSAQDGVILYFDSGPLVPFAFNLPHNWIYQVRYELFGLFLHDEEVHFLASTLTATTLSATFRSTAWSIFVLALVLSSSSASALTSRSLLWELGFCRAENGRPCSFQTSFWTALDTASGLAHRQLSRYRFLFCNYFVIDFF